MPLKYILLVKKDIIPVIKCVVKVFLYWEPMTKNLNISEKEFKYFASIICNKMVNEKMSYICKDEDNVVGFCLNEDFLSNPSEELNQVTIKMAPIFKILEALDKRYLKNKKSKPNSFFHLVMLGSLPEYRKQGIAKNLVQKSINLAKKKGFKWVVTEATNIKSQKLFRDYFKFKELQRINYKTFKFDKSVPFKNIGEKSSKLMELRLSLSL